MSKLHKNPMLEEYAFNLMEEMAQLKTDIHNHRNLINRAGERLQRIVECLAALGVDYEKDDINDEY